MVCSLYGNKLEKRHCSLILFHQFSIVLLFNRPLNTCTFHRGRYLNSQKKLKKRHTEMNAENFFLFHFLGLLLPPFFMHLFPAFPSVCWSCSVEVVNPGDMTVAKRFLRFVFSNQQINCLPSTGSDFTVNFVKKNNSVSNISFSDVILHYLNSNNFLYFRSTSLLYPLMSVMIFFFATLKVNTAG